MEHGYVCCVAGSVTELSVISSSSSSSHRRLEHLVTRHHDVSTARLEHLVTRHHDVSTARSAGLHCTSAASHHTSQLLTVLYGLPQRHRHGLNSAYRLAQDRERWKQLVETATLQSGACP